MIPQRSFFKATLTFVRHLRIYVPATNFVLESERVVLVCWCLAGLDAWLLAQRELRLHLVQSEELGNSHSDAHHGHHRSLLAYTVCLAQSLDPSSAFGR
jgi:hypothetical protein